MCLCDTIRVNSTKPCWLHAPSLCMTCTAYLCCVTSHVNLPIGKTVHGTTKQNLLMQCKSSSKLNSVPPSHFAYVPHPLLPAGISSNLPAGGPWSLACTMSVSHDSVSISSHVTQLVTNHLLTLLRERNVMPYC